MKKLFSLLLAAALILCSFSVVSAKTEQDTKTGGFGMNISSFNARILKSQDHLTGDVLGDYELTFVNYWATWCGPCVSEMPHINQMYQHYLETEENDVNVIGAVSISGSCTEDSASTFLINNHYGWTNVIPDSVLTSVFATSGYIPQTLIVNSDGIVVDHIVGSFPSYAELIEYVENWREILAHNYGEPCSVTFINEVTNEVIFEGEGHVGQVYSGSFPAAPTVEGYNFAEWIYGENCFETFYEPTLLMLTGDATVYAHYNIRRYLVRFYDSFNNHVLSSQQVEHGSAAVPPEEPNHPEEGLYFHAWDADFSCITGTTYIHSIYRHTGDVDGDLQVTIVDALALLRMSMGLNEVETNVFTDVDGDGEVTVADALHAMRTAMGVN
ncbi:MAG: InlB B-repeat-containing protein [Clostridia bacterium]|nr:InlB B-repeat-containing protein [Clostridia bacterium]